MKQLISKFLVVCLLAISLHGFGAAEHVAMAKDIQTITEVSSLDMEEPRDNMLQTLSAACDICQAVHQYLIVADGSQIELNAVARIKQMKFAPPPDRGHWDILHPPTI